MMDDVLRNIKENLKGKGILACSGGTDSSVLAAVSAMVAGEDVKTIFIDTGLLRIGEKERVEKLFSDFHINGEIVDASKRFIQNLAGVTDPERKRKIIGETFVREFEEIAKKSGAQYLLQGTIAPDWIESGGKNRDSIKSHHNVGGLPENMNLKLIEPLRDLYKDEVRQLSKEIGLDEYLQPFPGPGLAVRIVGEVTEERLDRLRRATKIVEETVESKYSKEDRPWQYFAIYVPVKTTGVHGDKRSYGDTIAIRAVNSLDAMTATFSRIDWDVIEEMSVRISNEIEGVNRVVYDVTHKPPGTIEWE
ncbi:glutamine-hydrolyzing GMP synthase [Cuniculiplasma thermophilum]|uniref:glutamine-hydrolyzing GMP synthase n=1 Tax=Cuniculiplasma sp. SKW3 TaxID=3400170 RepID=UPI003FD50DD3